MTVWRDPWGVPRVRGRDVVDTARLQGVVTAQDRAWQLEVERLRAQATTAEMFGPAGQVWDDFVREIDLPGVARRAYAGLSASTRTFVDGYVEGVRWALASVERPPEVEALGLDAVPGEWEPWTPLAVFALQHVLLSGFGSQLFHAHLHDVAGGEVAALFAGGGDLPRGGSNAIAVGGRLTASGRPLVAGDPHRLFEAPGVYQQVGLAGPGFDVVGLTFVGVPGVQHFGQTESVAWSITTAMADAVDAEVTDGRVTLHTPAAALGDLGFEALVPLLHARTVADVDAALDSWVEPVNDVVVADRDGAVLHRVAGRVPERAETGAGTGAWTGWAPLPRRIVGANEVAVSANDRTDAGYDVLQARAGAGRGAGFAPPLRRDRIAALLRERVAHGPVGVTDLLTVLTDVRQNAGDALLERLARLVPETAAGRALLDDLGAWDRRMTSGSVVAAQYVDVRDRLVAALADGPVLREVSLPAPHPLLAPWFDVAGQVATVLHDLVAHPGAGARLGVDVDAVLTQALDEVGAPTTAAGPRSWGQRHRFAPLHAFADFGLDPTPFLPSTHGAPLGGDTECVATAVAAPGSEWVVRGSCARHVWDVDDPSRSRWAVPTGAHGVVGHPHHSDQFAAWNTGTLLPARPFSLRDVDPRADADLLHRWVTAPGARHWGMADHSRDEVAEVYGWITDQPHLTARLIVHEGQPLGLVQTYDPFVDPIGDFYDRRPGDLGVHLLLADDPARAGLTPSITGFMISEGFADPGVERLVFEPDTGNARSVDLLRRTGAEMGPVVDLVLPTGAKRAQFAFLPRTLRL